VPGGKNALPGEMTAVTSVGADTPRLAEPLNVEKVAVIVVAPWARLVAKPMELIVATEAWDELQFAVLVNLSAAISEVAYR
jgi:hypothetical protein